MNCLCSTCRLTMNRGGWSATLPLQDYVRVARHAPGIGNYTVRLGGLSPVPGQGAHGMLMRFLLILQG
jgi:hypothetical protein